MRHANDTSSPALPGRAARGGPGFIVLLTLAFIVLKLARIIDWSWWWVLAPLWISALLLAGAVALLMVGLWKSNKP